MEENISRMPSDINHSKILLDPPPGAMKIKTKTNGWDLIKLTSFCAAKQSINKIKNNLQRKS